MNTSPIAPRRPWVAAMLSLLCWPLGYLYAGRGLRFFVVGALALSLVPLLGTLICFMPESRVAFNTLMIVVLCAPLFVIADSFRVARGSELPQRKWFQRWWIYLLVAIGFMFAADCASRLTRSYVVEPFVVPTGAMSPTIIAGDRVFVSKLAGDADTLDYGDVVAFHSDGPGSDIYVMRVVALGGDTIEIADEEVILNGSKVVHPQATFEGELPAYPDLAEMSRIEIPKDSFFVLGDFRRRSLDSRFLGPIPRRDFYGKAIRIYWSLPRIIHDPMNPAEDEFGPVAWERHGLAIH